MRPYAFMLNDALRTNCGMERIDEMRNNTIIALYELIRNNNLMTPELDELLSSIQSMDSRQLLRKLDNVSCSNPATSFFLVCHKCQTIAYGNWNKCESCNSPLISSCGGDCVNREERILCNHAECYHANSTAVIVNDPLLAVVDMLTSENKKYLNCLTRRQHALRIASYARYGVISHATCVTTACALNAFGEAELVSLLPKLPPGPSEQLFVLPDDASYFYNTSK